MVKRAGWIPSSNRSFIILHLCSTERNGGKPVVSRYACAQCSVLMQTWGVAQLKDYHSKLMQALNSSKQF